jgi:hypothetical protein
METRFPISSFPTIRRDPSFAAAACFPRVLIVPDHVACQSSLIILAHPPPHLAARGAPCQLVTSWAVGSDGQTHSLLCAYYRLRVPDDMLEPSCLRQIE